MNWIENGFFLIGLGLVIWGVYKIYPPAAAIAGGGLLILCSMILHSTKRAP